MERRLKERLIGAAVLVMLAVIFIPMILSDSSETEVKIEKSNIPTRPKENFNSRIIPLEESDLTPVPLESSNIEIQAQEDPVELVKKEIQQEAMPAPEAESAAKQQEKASVPSEPGASKSKPVGATAWVIQLGSFQSNENASTLNEKLRKAGYPAFVEPLKRSTGMVYRVRVGPELLRSDALKLQEKLKKEMKIEGIVIRYP